jgi:hypothetical protein
MTGERLYCEPGIGIQELNFFSPLYPIPFKVGVAASSNPLNCGRIIGRMD